MIAAARSLRFRWWVLVTGARLRRLGGRLVVQAAAAPRLRGALRLEPGPRPGTLTLRIGRAVTIGRDCVIELTEGAGGEIDLADGVTLQSQIRLQPWGGAIRIGDRAQVRDNCELKSKGELRIGALAVCGRNATLHCHASVTLGDHVGLGSGVSITDSDHRNSGTDTWFLQEPVHAEPVTLERNVLCGTNAVVLKGALIRCNAVVAAGAVVTGGEHAGGWLIGGVPARALKPLPAVNDDDPPAPL